ncbi:unnamed protein product, partial [Closterium sp. NIES-64]
FSFLWRSYVPSWAPEFAGVAHGVSSGIRRRGARCELRNPQAWRTARRTVGAAQSAAASHGGSYGIRNCVASVHTSPLPLRPPLLASPPMFAGVSRSGISGNSRVAQHVGSGIRMPTPRDKRECDLVVRLRSAQHMLPANSSVRRLRYTEYTSNLGLGCGDVVGMCVWAAGVR